MEKLVRDKIIEFSRAASDGREFRVASEDEILALFAKKILEEAHEVAQELKQNPINVAALAQELGDLTEVLQEVLARLGLVDTVEQARAEKRAIKGGFKNGLVLNLATDIARKN